jgi:hypothetical protein
MAADNARPSPLTSSSASRPAGRCCLHKAEYAYRDEREHRGEGCDGWSVKGRHAPVRPDDVVGVERLVAVAAEVERDAVRQHFNFDIADQRVDRFVIGSGLAVELQKECAPGGEISVGAFVERAFFVRDAAGNDPSEAGERLKVQIILQPPGRKVESEPGAGQRQARRQIVADHRHLAMRETRYGDAFRRRPAARGDPMRFGRRGAEHEEGRNEGSPCASHARPPKGASATRFQRWP